MKAARPTQNHLCSGKGNPSCLKLLHECWQKAAHDDDAVEIFQRPSWRRTLSRRRSNTPARRPCVLQPRGSCRTSRSYSRLHSAGLRQQRRVGPVQLWRGISCEPAGVPMNQESGAWPRQCTAEVSQTCRTQCCSPPRCPHSRSEKTSVSLATLSSSSPLVLLPLPRSVAQTPIAVPTWNPTHAEPDHCNAHMQHHYQHYLSLIHNPNYWV